MQTSSLVTRFRSLRPLDPAESVKIRVGAIADYDELASHHYRAARPATCVRVLVAEGERRALQHETAGRPLSKLPGDVLTRSPAHALGRRSSAGRTATSGARARPLVGVLVVSMPTLNGAWRRVAWPDLFPRAPALAAASAGPVPSSTSAESAPSGAARALNAQVRCISRLVVHPDWRALGIGRRLVEAYLAAPLTPRTEAVSAMGACCPVFEAAGMRRVLVPDTPDDARLRGALRLHGLEPPDLLDLSTSPRRALSLAVRRALRAWAWRNKGCRAAVLRGDDAELARLAATRLAGVRTVFVAP